MNAFEREYAMALDRKENPQDGSYTNYLFDKGLEKILKKIGEESTEVVVAALSQSKEELIGEISDLTYHVIVMMVEKGITLEDIAKELDHRAQKQGNLKPERKPITQR
ncbi:MAG: phosphoribosyl-ATP diphosphatase [Erysipelotrichaceae bacterium]|nr:phosphoribosyl-ATP diphosphatase [Erysipelotrichaceae bacterium]